MKEAPKKDKSFNLVVKVITAEKNKVQAQSCVDYTGDGEHSGMAIMEFGLPSGFSLDRDDIEKVRFIMDQVYDYLSSWPVLGMLVTQWLVSPTTLFCNVFLQLLSGNSSIKRIETPGRKSIFYFDKVSPVLIPFHELDLFSLCSETDLQISKSDPLCVNITSLRTHAVGKSQPIPVVVYDYYKPGMCEEIQFISH